MAETLDIVIAGVGGHGTVLASQLLAQAALSPGLEVRTAETIGMAQRGGSVLGHVRIGPRSSPLVPLASADLLIGFEPTETLRTLPRLKDGGIVVTAMRGIEPSLPQAAEQLRSCGRIGKLVEVDGDALCAKLGTGRVLNVLLIGAALGASAKLGASTQLIDLRAVEAALEPLLRPQYLDINRLALRTGAAST
jgi:indolepyruvate ferredoxin oxidoreductase beta subunit